MLTPHMVSDYQSFDPKQLTQRDMYRLLIQLVTPRPIALVSSSNADGSMNLAPFSFFNAVCALPPTLMLSLSSRPDGRQKDTLANITTTKEFVVNSTNENILEAVVACAAMHEPGVDEAMLNNLTRIPSTQIKPSRIAESAAHFECRLAQTIVLGNPDEGGSTVIFGTIVALHINRSVIDQQKIDPKRYRTVGRLGGIQYTKLGEIVSIPVPEVVK